MNVQSTGAVLMVRPANFGFNPETAQSNVFQQPDANPLTDVILREFDAAVTCLRSNGIEVIVWDDSPKPEKPDAIFPNNWLGVHPGKRIVVYPMYASNRRIERDPAILKLIGTRAEYQLIDFTAFENENMIIEGTGSLVFDHLQMKVFACRSTRTNEQLANYIAGKLGYEAIVFDAFDADGVAYYHTNVVLAIGTNFAIVCEEAIEEKQRTQVLLNLSKPEKDIILISKEQVKSFAGNMLELRNDRGELLIVLSETAFLSLNKHQREELEKAGKPVVVSIPTIEQTGGGSIRCMLGEIF